MDRVKEVYKVTIAGSIINVVLLVLKFAAGILGHSAAMIADAIHSLTDFATDVVVLVFVKLGNKPMDKDHDYGHGKYETLATAIIGISLFVVGVMICYWCYQDLSCHLRRDIAAAGRCSLDCCHRKCRDEGVGLSVYGKSRKEISFRGCSGECLASSQRCFIEYRNDVRYWRCHYPGRKVGGARSACSHHRECLHHQGRLGTGDAVCERTDGCQSSRN